MLLEKKAIKEKYLPIVLKEWLSADGHFPDFLPEITKETKESNELYIKNLSEDFQNRVKDFPRLPFRRNHWKKKMLNKMNETLSKENLLGIHNSMSTQALSAFQEELMEFIRHVRIFAPELSFEEIGQALRNYIVYAMFKEIHQVKTGFCMAGFGYSMLYPLTDNYIDSDLISEKEKSVYNKLIRDMIEGRRVHPESVHQQKTCELLQAIESEYPREKDPAAFTLLLMMLEAQEESLQQQKKNLPLSYEQMLDISLYKGGISVLIDRFFVRKELTEEEIILYLGLGFFLQIADDLQDIREDSEQGYQTILTLDQSPEYTELVVNKLLNFIHNIMGAYRAENDSFKSFVLSNCYQLIYTSVIRSREYFSTKFLLQIEKRLPVSASFYEESKSNLVTGSDLKTQEKYMRMLDAMISNGHKG